MAFSAIPLLHHRYKAKFKASPLMKPGPLGKLGEAEYYMGKRKNSLPWKKVDSDDGALRWNLYTVRSLPLCSVSCIDSIIIYYINILLLFHKWSCVISTWINSNVCP